MIESLRTRISPRFAVVSIPEMSSRCVVPLPYSRSLLKDEDGFQCDTKSLFQGDEVWFTQILFSSLSLTMSIIIVVAVSYCFYWLTVDQNCYTLIHSLYQYDHLTHSLFTFSGCTPKSPQKVLKCRGFLTKKHPQIYMDLIKFKLEVNDPDKQMQEHTQNSVRITAFVFHQKENPQINMNQLPWPWCHSAILALSGWLLCSCTQFSLMTVGAAAHRLHHLHCRRAFGDEWIQI